MNELQVARRRLMSGPYLAVKDREQADLLLVIAISHSSEELEHLADSVAEQQRRSPTFKPIFLVGAADTQCLSSRSFPFEVLLNRQEWDRLKLPGSYDGYRRGRVRAMEALYAPATVIEASPGGAVQLPPLTGEPA